jgi:4,5-DOPA dioxygenase extradiol
MDGEWGLDHGCWSVLKQMYPRADIPVIELSLDHSRPAPFHYELAKELAPLRRRGVLVIASGNMVHNLGRIAFPPGGPGDLNRHFGLDWALEANALFRRLIEEGRHGELADYGSLGPAVALAVPTPEHYLPLLYALALKEADEPIAFFNDAPVGGSLTMTSLRIG